MTFAQIRSTAHYFVLIPTILYCVNDEVTGHLIPQKSKIQQAETGCQTKFG